MAWLGATWEHVGRDWTGLDALPGLVAIPTGGVWSRSQLVVSGRDPNWWCLVATPTGGVWSRSSQLVVVTGLDASRAGGRCPSRARPELGAAMLEAAMAGRGKVTHSVRFVRDGR